MPDICRDGIESMNLSATARFPKLALPAKSDGRFRDHLDLESAELSDEVLLEQISKGSRESLSVLFKRYARVVRGVAYRVLRDTSEADDLLQDIFLLVHRLCRTFDSSKGS